MALRVCICSMQKLITSSTPQIPFSHIQKSASFKLSTPFLTNKIKTQANNTSSNMFCTTQNPPSIHSDLRPTQVQELNVYEFNELDRASPVYLRLSGKSANSLGDIVSFTNKIYSGDLKKRLGISAGSLLVMNVPGKTTKGDDYEAMISFYLGDHGHISCQGPYKSHEDTWMAVTGGTGIFSGVRGQVKVHNLSYPLKLYYVFQLKGISQLPAELTAAPVEPKPDVQPAPEAKVN